MTIISLETDDTFKNSVIYTSCNGFFNIDEFCKIDNCTINNSYKYGVALRIEKDFGKQIFKLRTLTRN